VPYTTLFRSYWRSAPTSAPWPQRPRARGRRSQRDRSNKIMATVTATPVEQQNYLNADFGIKSWLLTTDHKRIALLYLISVTLMFFIGGFAATLVRLELITPAGDLMT